MSAPDLPRTGLTAVRRVPPESLPAQPTSTVRGRLPHRLLSAAAWRLLEGRMQGRRHDAITESWSELDARLVHRWSTELRLIDNTDSAAGGPLTADPAVADSVADELAAPVRDRESTPPRATPTLGLEAAVARRLAGSRDLLAGPDGGLYWRAQVADPVRGGADRAPEMPGPTGATAAAGLMGRLRRFAPVDDPEPPPGIGTGWLRRRATGTHP